MPLKVSDGIGAWIKDFKKSDAPQFKGKSEKERRDQAIAAYLSAKRGPQKEEFTFKVDVEGLPDMFMKGNSPGEVKTHLRKLVKQPSMVKSVDRATKYDVKKKRKDQMKLGEAVSADKKPEKYVGPDGKTKVRMVPVTREGMNKRDVLRRRLAMVGKDMEKTNKELKKTVGIEDKPKVRLGSDGKPYKSKYEQSAPKKGAQPKKQGFMQRLRTGGIGAAIMGNPSPKGSIANKTGMY